jgi:signal transduction histidine kinase
VTEAKVADIETRATRFARGSDLGWVASLLTERREEILERWLEVSATQPFHAGRRERAIADDIPRLFDALVALLRRGAPAWVDPSPPLDDPSILQAARAHADARFRQGLRAADIITEFRLLRQEVGRALRLNVPDDVPTDDVVGADLLLNDAVDAAASLALEALTGQIEETREDFLATTLHDVRQPPSSIKGGIQLAMRGIARPDLDRERIRTVLALAEAETNRMISLLETLGDASRLALGRLEPHAEPANLVTLLHGAIERLNGAAAERVRCDIPDNLDANGVWDAAMLDRVIANLLSNALKYSPAASEVKISVRAHDGALQLSVRDDGIGVAADELPRLFRRYGRADGAVAAGIDGLGLGLYLSKGIVEAHGGRIWAESAGARLGTTFHVILPRAAVADTR